MSSPRKPVYSGNGTFWLLAINLAVFVADHMLHVSQVPAFYLYHMSPRWWQVSCLVSTQALALYRVLCQPCRLDFAVSIVTLVQQSRRCPG